MTDSFASSDDNRSNSPLAHAQSVTFPGPHKLLAGGVLPELTVAYETYGTLNPDASNAVLIGHALTGDSHLARHAPDDDAGWWEQLVGPGLGVDTDELFVVCANILGGCRGTTGPNTINPETGQPYGPQFPTVQMQDIADAHAKLLDHLGIQKLKAAIGGSLGGHQAMTLATRYPERVGTCIAIASSPRLTAQALAFDVVGRNAIIRDPFFHGGHYYDQKDKPTVGLAIARMLGHITYLSPESMQQKFDPDRLRPRDVETDFEKEFSVGSYLAYQGDKFVERFDANSYLVISKAMDLFDLGQTPELLAQTLDQSTCDWVVMSFSSDWLFTPQQSRDIVDALTRLGRRVTYCEVPSEAGHDGFLLEDEVRRFGQIVKAKLSGQTSKTSEADPRKRGPRSIFGDDRIDYQTIVGLIDPAASVLDVGCGPGGLLAELKTRGQQDLQGIEVAEADIITSAQRGLDVIDHDLNRGLELFSDGRFDVVVLSQTLQAIVEVERVVDEMLRVGRRVIVSFPNFGYEPLRRMLFEEGRSPKSEGRFSYEWFNTPNRRFATIADFEVFCDERQIHRDEAVFLDSESGKQINGDVNRLADTAIYVLSRSAE